MDTGDVESAEREASEVLHSLLSIERIEKPSQDDNMQQIVVVQRTEEKDDIDWQSPEHQPIFATIDESGNYVQTNDRVIWGGTISIDVETISAQNQFLDDENDEVVSTEVIETAEEEHPLPERSKPKKKPVRKKYKKVFNVDERTVELENNVQDVRARFQLGCECNDDSCFRGLNPETVYRHRLNIAELTKEEHDMYLMGVTMACMSDPGVTVKRKERQRLRTHYVYHGRRVCLSAFLYLENCTLYQLKRIRKHVMTHGVTPRVHGNHGKKPHNVFSLDIYRRATNFLKSYIQSFHSASSGNLKSPVVLPSDISRKTIHNVYQEYVKRVAPPDEKIMGYSTFRHFMKEQYPHVRFCKTELGASSNNNNHSNNNTVKTTVGYSRTMKSDLEKVNSKDGDLASATQVSTIPVILSTQTDKSEVVGAPTYIVTPIQQIVHAQQDFTSYQPHTITVTPMTNAAYAFSTI